MEEKINHCVCCGHPITEEEHTFQKLKGIREIVVNACHGGFSLSYEAELEYLKRAGIKYTLESRGSRDEDIRFGPKILVNDISWSGRHDIVRDDPVLVQLVKDWGDDVNGGFANLAIVRIPGDVDWIIEEYDGLEWVAENHRTWYAR